MKIISWNIAGLNAIMKKGFLEWLSKERPDIFCAQETKISDEDKKINFKEYYDFWAFSESKKGYSGVLTLSKEKPKTTQIGIGKSEFDIEGRSLIHDFENFILFNIYFPNGQRSKERLDYKMAFYDYFLKIVKKLIEKDKKIIVCGDFNTAHHEIDLARPKSNEKISGFLPIEREWIDKFEAVGFIDTFRYKHPNEVKYCYWSQRTNARERNVGWRIDYIFISKNLLSKLKEAFIQTEVMGSDHCPIGIEIEL